MTNLEEAKEVYRKFDLEERLIDFAVAILALAEQLPQTYSSKHLKQQITRSSTSPALNYGEAMAAVSRADFIHRMGVCLKELRETQICLRIISKSNMLSFEKVKKDLQECSELVAIFTTSIETAKKNKNP